MLRAMCFGIGLLAVLAVPVLGDFYDNFDDGQICEDPNHFDIDDPCWVIQPVGGDVFIWDANDGELRLYSSSSWIPFSFLGAVTNDGDSDPNTSQTWFSSAGPHYILAKMRFNPATPNEGAAGFAIHGNFDWWTAYLCDYQADDNWFEFIWVNGGSFDQARGGHTEAGLDEPNGFWMLVQFEPAGRGDPNDPNNHKLRAAVWNGGKYDWDGTWDIDLFILTAWDPNLYTYWDVGQCSVASMSSSHTGKTMSCDVKYDNIECRWGRFSNVSHTLKLTVVRPNYGVVEIDPNLVDPDDPNLRRYTDGTEIVLVAKPNSSRVFAGWSVFDPNFPGDANHVVIDANATLYLTMDTDWEVEAEFKCGSGMLPVLAVAGLVMGLAVLIRRRG